MNLLLLSSVFIFQMSNSERGDMFYKCEFTLKDRAHFVGICMEYASQTGRPIEIIY